MAPCLYVQCCKGGYDFFCNGFGDTSSDELVRTHKKVARMDPNYRYPTGKITSDNDWVVDVVDYVGSVVNGSRAVRPAVPDGTSRVHYLLKYNSGYRIIGVDYTPGNNGVLISDNPVDVLPEWIVDDGTKAINETHWYSTVQWLIRNYGVGSTAYTRTAFVPLWYELPSAAALASIRCQKRPLYGASRPTEELVTTSFPDATAAASYFSEYRLAGTATHDTGYGFGRKESWASSVPMQVEITSLSSGLGFAQLLGLQDPELTCSLKGCIGPIGEDGENTTVAEEELLFEHTENIMVGWASPGIGGGIFPSCVGKSLSGTYNSILDQIVIQPQTFLFQHPFSAVFLLDRHNDNPVAVLVHGTQINAFRTELTTVFGPFDIGDTIDLPLRPHPFSPSNIPEAFAGQPYIIEELTYHNAIGPLPTGTVAVSGFSGPGNFGMTSSEDGINDRYFVGEGPVSITCVPDGSGDYVIGTRHYTGEQKWMYKAPNVFNATSDGRLLYYPVGSSEPEWEVVFDQCFDESVNKHIGAAPIVADRFTYQRIQVNGESAVNSTYIRIRNTNGEHETIYHIRKLPLINPFTTYKPFSPTGGGDDLGLYGVAPVYQADQLSTPQ